MIKVQPKRSIILKWLKWHFFEAPLNILRALRNFLLGNLYYFSIPTLIRTLFSHWRRYRESYGKGFDPKRYIQAFVGNSISRILGAIVRISTIIIGAVAELFILIAGIIIFISWILLPLISILLIWSGIDFLIKL